MKELSFIGNEPNKLRHAVKNKNGKDLFFQPKLTVGPADDRYEREADAVADQIMHMPGNEQIQTKISPVAIQRKCAACEDEEHVQRKEEGAIEELEAPSIVSDALGSGGSPLDDSSRSFMENRFGYDFSNVKIHTDAVAAKSAQSINALAYTSGNDIVFNSNQYAPATENGKRLLAHELTHVVQQRGAVQRQTSDESEVENPEQGGVREQTSGTETKGVGDKQGGICCNNDEVIVPQTGRDFDINNSVTLEEMCTNSGCMNITIASHWATAHAARHFRISMAVFDSPTSIRTISRRYNVGRETQRFDIGRCKNFMLTIQVISPSTSPHLVGTIDIRNC